MSVMSRAWGSPSRYIQGAGEIKRLPEHTEKYGDRIGAVIDEFFFDSYTKMLKNQYEKKGKVFCSVKYDKEITVKPRLFTAQP